MEFNDFVDVAKKAFDKTQEAMPMVIITSGKKEFPFPVNTEHKQLSYSLIGKTVALLGEKIDFITSLSECWMGTDPNKLPSECADKDEGVIVVQTEVATGETKAKMFLIRGNDKRILVEKDETKGTVEIEDNVSKTILQSYLETKGKMASAGIKPLEDEDLCLSKMAEISQKLDNAKAFRAEA